MSYKLEVRELGTDRYSSNSLRFATSDEAMAYGRDLLNRWYAIDSVRAVETTDPVTYKWDTDSGSAIPVEA